MRLVPHMEHDQCFAPGETCSFTFAASRDEFIEIFADQCSVDVTLSVVDPSGKTTVMCDVWSKLGESEQVMFVTEKTGRHQLDIRNISNDAGCFLLHVGDWRPCVSGDWSWIHANAAEQKGRALIAEKNKNASLLALESFKDSLICYRDIGDKVGEARLLNRLGLLNRRLGRMQTAINRFNEGLSVVSQTHDPYEHGKIHANTALAVIASGDLQKGLGHLLKAQGLLRDLGDDIALARVSNSIGGAYEILGEYARALVHLSISLEIFESGKKTREIGTVLNNIALVFDKMGESEKALSYFEQALKTYETVDVPGRQAVTLMNMGSLFRNLRRCDEALHCLERSTNIFKNLGAIDKIGNSLHAKGSALLCLGQSDSAIESLERALDFRKRASDTRGASATLLDLAKAYRGEGELPKAVQHVQEAWETVQTVDDRNLQARILFSWAQILRAMGAFGDAEEKVRQAIELVELESATVPHYDLRATYLAARSDYFEFYIDLLMERHLRDPQAGFDRQAFDVVERCRARGLLDALKANGDGHAEERGEDSQVKARREELLVEIYRREQDALTRRPADSYGKADAFEDVTTQELLTEFISLAVTRDAPLAQAETMDEPICVGVDQVQRELLDEDSVLLVYALGDKRSFGWVVTRNELAVFVLPPREDVERAAKRALRLLRTNAPGLRDARRDAVTELSRMVIAPLAKHIGRHPRIIIMADGGLHFVPFSALTISGFGAEALAADNPEKGVPLLVTHQVVSVPSLSVIDALDSEPHRHAPGALVVFADPVFDPRDPRISRHRAQRSTSNQRSQSEEVTPSRPVFPRLWSSRSEADGVAASIAGEPSTVYLDFDASLETLYQTDLNRYDVIHFATHGLVNAQRPELSGLVLSLVHSDGTFRDGLLGLHRIYSLDLDASLVVLSACDTALGREIRGEGLQALTRAFLCAGADAVVGSLWTVPDHTTSELMTLFYSAMFMRQLHPAEALRAAKLALIEKEPQVTPYHWAGFVFQGDWH